MGPIPPIASLLFEWLCFHSTDCPSKWGLGVIGFGWVTSKMILVSIQLIAPVSGAIQTLLEVLLSSNHNVSIQLIAPASGAEIAEAYAAFANARFHSTDCPSKWGQAREQGHGEEDHESSVSIQLIAPASGAPNSPSGTVLQKLTPSFHSTDCPSKWGHVPKYYQLDRGDGHVSFHSTDCPSKWGRI